MAEIDGEARAARGGPQYEVHGEPRSSGDADWHVGAVDDRCEGVLYTAMFVGTEAEQRAREYAAWKNAHADASWGGVNTLEVRRVEVEGRRLEVDPPLVLTPRYGPSGVVAEHAELGLRAWGSDLADLAERVGASLLNVWDEYAPDRPETPGGWNWRLGRTLRERVAEPASRRVRAT